MRPFDYRRAENIEDATRMLGQDNVALAGGTDLVTLLRNGLRQPKALVDIKHSELPAGIAADDDGITIGALTTISEIEHDKGLREHYALLCEAAALTATPQLRNRATLGGNLLQDSRCWYFRDPDMTCWLRGGTECYARAGRHDRHAIAGDHPCITVHPSDLAGCLVALDASLQLISDAGSRTLRVADFLTSPTADHRRLHALDEGELIAAIRIPAPSDNLRSTYIKAMSRKAWSFALVGVAAAVDLDGSRITRARVVLNGVAPEPLSLDDPTADGPLECGEVVSGLVAEFDEAVSPLPRNRYKVPLTHALIAEAINKLGLNRL